MPSDCNGQGFIQALLLMLTWWKKIEFYKQKSNCEAIETAVWYLEKIHGRVSGGKANFYLFNVFKVIKQSTVDTVHLYGLRSYISS